MALIVEDGSLVESANSWVSRETFIAYALARGVTVADDAETDAKLIKACDYINGLEPNLKGCLVERDQATAYPRSGLEIEGWYWTASEIPRQVLNAQLSLALELQAGEDIYNPTLATLPVVSKRVEGAVTVQYANPSQALKVNKEQPSQVHIKLLLKHSGLSVVRV
tara:strand:- start:22130 stop:22627 length:498 start_codon:yes stop_codon:yes gene_type:complete